MAGSRARRRWLFPATLIAVAIASAWAYAHMPPRAKLGHARVYGNVALSAPGMRDRWTMHLRLDPEVKPPGPRWVLHDGRHAGDGYELRWLPEKLGLLVYRAPDQFLLGAARLTSMPRTVDFVRQGPWFAVRIDGDIVLTCLDPLAMESTSPEAWGCDTAGTGGMGDAEITLLDDGAGADPDGASLSEAQRAAVSGVRAALLAVAGASPTEGSAPIARAEAAIGAAGGAMALLPAGELRDRLRHWLALAEINLALARTGPEAAAGELEDVAPWVESAQRARDAVEQLALLREQTPAPETAGMLLSLLPSLANRACFRPAVPMHAETVLWLRALWMNVLGATATVAGAALDPAAGEHLHYELRLLVHAAGCLMPPDARLALADERDGLGWSGGPLPLPAESPAWLAARWRAFAGGDPEGTHLPELPEPRAPAATAIETLSRDAVLEPTSALTMCQRLRALLALPAVARALDDPQGAHAPETLAAAAQVANAIRELGRSGAAGEGGPMAAAMSLGLGRNAAKALLGPSPAGQAPLREQRLAQALLALGGVGSADAAAQSLIAPFEGGPPLAQRDPLAYAVLALLMRREGAAPDLPAALSAQDALQNVRLKRPRELRELSRFEGLLSGSRDATSEAWLQDPKLLPPAQALATALAMQEGVAPPGKTPSIPPSWRLLRKVRCFTLPLELLAGPKEAGEEHPGEEMPVVP